jgi:hypothetical protein
MIKNISNYIVTRSTVIKNACTSFGKSVPWAFCASSLLAYPFFSSYSSPASISFPPFSLGTFLSLFFAGPF